MKTANLRWVEPKDMKAVLGLIQELADFEKEPDAVVITEDDLQNHAFGQRPKFKCLVAEKEGQVIGMALFYPRYSTWKGPTFHLEDLIVTQRERGIGVGKALYNAFIEYAVSEGVRRVEWAVLDWNTNAIKFYENSGAHVLDDWRTVQMDEATMRRYIAKQK